LMYAPGMGPFASEFSVIEDTGDYDKGQVFPHKLPSQASPPKNIDISVTKWGRKYKHLVSKWTDEDAPPWLPIERGWKFCTVKTANGVDMVKTERYYLTPEGVVCSSFQQARKYISEEEESANKKGGKSAKFRPWMNKREDLAKQNVERAKIASLTSSSKYQNKVVERRSQRRYMNQYDKSVVQKRYWLVFNHIRSQRQCHCIPLVEINSGGGTSLEKSSSSSSSSSSKKKKGRRRFKANPDKSQEIFMSEEKLRVVDATVVKHSVDVNKEVWDIKN